MVEREYCTVLTMAATLSALREMTNIHWAEVR
jgi:hypothetical protein